LESLPKIENILIKKAAWVFSAYANSGCGIARVFCLTKAALLSTSTCTSAAPAMAPRGQPNSIPNDLNVSFPNQPIEILLYKKQLCIYFVEFIN
jgi:hypothetical protein